SELGDGVSAGTAEQASAVRIVVIAVPWDRVPDAVQGIDWNGQIVIDATNDWGADDLNGRTSSELVAELVAGARVVKAAYTLGADRRDAERQKALFTEDTRFAVYLDGEGSRPTYVLQGREALTSVFDDLNRYEVTTHFNGQSTVTLDGDRAAGESYTIAH